MNETTTSAAPLGLEHPCIATLPGYSSILTSGPPPGWVTELQREARAYHTLVGGLEGLLMLGRLRKRDVRRLMERAERIATGDGEQRGSEG